MNRHVAELWGLPVHTDERMPTSGPHSIAFAPAGASEEEIDRIVTACQTAADFDSIMRTIGEAVRASNWKLEELVDGLVGARLWGEAVPEITWPERDAFRPPFAAIRCEVASTRKGLIV